MSLTAEQLSNLRREVGEGREIQALLSNEVIQRALNGALHGLQNAWLTERNAGNREQLWQRAAGLQEFIGALQTIVDTGKFAEHTLAAEAAINGEKDD